MRHKPLTEAEWAACADPARMLPQLDYNYSHRKRRLFACACVRLVWDVLPDARSRIAVEVAERFADGAAAKKELIEARKKALQAWRDFGESSAARVAVTVAGWDAVRGAEDAAAGVRRTVALVLGGAAAAKERERQCRVLRDLFGNPFRPTPAIAASCLKWNDGAVRKFAQAIYDDRAFDRLPLLADALEDAGCDNADILRHCRTPGEHVRGCWAVDLLLGKE